MTLEEYFEQTQGVGVLATADSDGVVNQAVYARPHVVDEQTVAFIMRDRLSHSNLKSNLHASFLFVEQGPGYKGKRLHLTKTNEETNTTLIDSLRRRQPSICTKNDDSNKFLVYFHVDRVRPLVGNETDQAKDLEYCK